MINWVLDVHACVLKPSGRREKIKSRANNMSSVMIFTKIQRYHMASYWLAGHVIMITLLGIAYRGGSRG